MTSGANADFVLLWKKEQFGFQKYTVTCLWIYRSFIGDIFRKRAKFECLQLCIEKPLDVQISHAKVMTSGMSEPISADFYDSVYFLHEL